MAGMRALGRVYDVINSYGTTSTVTVNMAGCSGMGVSAVTGATGTSTLTFTAGGGVSSASTAVTAANGFTQPTTWYARFHNTGAGSAGSTGWQKQTAVWTSNALTIGGTAGNEAYVDLLVSQLADTYDYVKVVSSNAQFSIIQYDLTVQRTPENLRTPSS